MNMPVLSPDTQATALLVGRFGKGQAKPLTRTDFNRVAQTLHQRGLRPSDLFQKVPSDLPIDELRISGLIARGTALALAVEEWGQLGIRVVSRGDAAYPARFKTLLKGGSTPILYWAGDLSLLDRPTLSVVGSRDATTAGLDFAHRIGEHAAAEGVVIVSGDARGIDRAAMESALAAQGQVVGVLADSLAKGVLSKRYRQAIANGQLLLLSHVEPDARFSIGQAMERNRYIYAAGDAVIVADSDIQGGTWSGAIENLKHRWAPAYVRLGSEVREGNAALAREGLIEISETWLDEEHPIASLFGADMVESDTLPLFEPAKPRAEAVVETEDRQVLFSLFLEKLGAALDVPQTAGTIAARFAIEPNQAEKWLKQAQSLGKVTFEADGKWMRVRA